MKHLKKLNYKLIGENEPRHTRQLITIQVNSDKEGFSEELYEVACTIQESDERHSAELERLRYTDRNQIEPIDVTSCDCTIENTLQAIVSELTDPTRNTNHLDCDTSRLSCVATTPSYLHTCDLRSRSKSESDLSKGQVRAGTTYKKFQGDSDYLTPDIKFAKNIVFEETDLIYKLPSSVQRQDAPGADDGPEIPPKRYPDSTTSTKECDAGLEISSLHVTEDVYRHYLADMNEDPSNISDIEDNSDYMIPENVLSESGDVISLNSEYALPSNAVKLDLPGADDGPELPPKYVTLSPKHETGLESRRRSKSESELRIKHLRAGSSYKKFKDCSDNQQTSGSNFAKHVIVDGSDEIYKVPSNVPRRDHPDANKGPALPPKKSSSNPRTMSYSEQLRTTKPQHEIVRMRRGVIKDNQKSRQRLPRTNPRRTLEDDDNLLNNSVGEPPLTPDRISIYI